MENSNLGKSSDLGYHKLRTHEREFEYMNKKIRVAIIGYGNVGKAAVEAVLAAPDMEFAGLVRPTAGELPVELTGHRVVRHIRELTDVSVAVLCTPSRLVPEIAKETLTMGINTVDSYDIHGSSLLNLRKTLGETAKAHSAVSIISAGWDPGTDSMIRGIMEAMAPRGVTYTNFGPGMSMGHTVVVKAIPGVKNALSLTIPTGMGVHRRAVYVQLSAGADPARIEEQIKTDPYFVKDDTHVQFVDDVTRLIDMGHGVLLERKGVAGNTHNQLLKYEMRINNPSVTAQIMVSAARATTRQAPGSYTLLEVPIINLLPGDLDDLVEHMV